MIGLSIDRTGIDVVKKYVEELNITFPTLHDPTANVATKYGVRGVPTTYFIDSEGKAIGFVIGPRSWNSQEVHRFVEQLLGEVKP